LNNPRVATSALVEGPPRMEYRRLRATEALPRTALCAISFGAQRPASAGAPQGLCVQVNLQALVGTGLTELWHADGTVESGRDGPVHFASGGRYLAGRVEIDEREVGGLVGAARTAYEAISDFTRRSGHRHLLRMYNYFSNINAGDGDAERYKLFCSGRAAGFHGLPDPTWPAATSIGRKDDSSVLQVYWLASNEAGRALENPRQVSAFHYPRQYGPAPPSFSRAMQVAGALLISGTASVLGHASHHRDDLAGQLDEILRNLATLRQASGGDVAAHTGRGTLLKVYLRNGDAAGFVATYLRARLPAQVQFLVLGADICRRELLAEIDAAHLIQDA
jgi:chorismate lyase / 3-hydroxybenzoate synthase